MQGFNHHITVHHNIFNYIAYVHYLLTEDPLEFTGADSAVYNSLRVYKSAEERASWIPINRSLSLRSQESREDENKLQQEGT